MSTLYRDYRPQKFAEVLGQKHIKITLQNEIAQQKLAQAFYFVVRERLVKPPWHVF